jgi:uncharacterized protein (UPF0548 family)
MWSIFRPSEEAIARFIIGQSRLPPSYPEVGASASTPPAGYTVDHNRVQLGTGKAVFDAAANALRRWQQFPASMTSVHPPDTPIQVGYTVAVLARVLGVWWLNAARIVYVIDEVTPLRRFGFAYGTLPDHVERGEERFCIEHHADDTVWYDILAFSQPRHWTARLGYPLSRRMQKRFAQESKAAMARAVAEAKGQSRG